MGIKKKYYCGHYDIWQTLLLIFSSFKDPYKIIEVIDKAPYKERREILAKYAREEMFNDVHNTNGVQ
jgi:hypothetical protein